MPGLTASDVADNQIYPVFCGVAVERKGDLLIRSPDGLAVYPAVPSASEFLLACDGRRSLTAILRDLELDDDEPLVELTLALVGRAVIRDARAAHVRFREATLNPPPAPPAYAEEEVVRWERHRPQGAYGSVQAEGLSCRLTEVLALRQSAVLPLTTASPAIVRANVLWCLRALARAGGAGPVPSAGGLRPLVFHGLVPAAACRLEVVAYDDEQDSFALIRTTQLSEADIAMSPDMALALRAGAGLTVISVDPRRTCAKYGPRGYVFALLEAGAALQTMHLLAAERRIEFRTMASFLDEPLRTLLDEPADVWPVITALIGGRSRTAASC